MKPNTITTRSQLATREKLYTAAASTYSTFDPTVREDFKQLTIRTQAWLGLCYSDGSKGWLPIKFGAYDCTVPEYSQYRRVLDSAKAVEVVSKWGIEAPKGHPAFQQIRDFCEAHGLACRSDFRVILISGTFDLPSSVPTEFSAAPEGEDAKDRLIADFICNALPSLCPAQRARVVALAVSL